RLTGLPADRANPPSVDGVRPGSPRRSDRRLVAAVLFREFVSLSEASWQSGSGASRLPRKAADVSLVSLRIDPQWVVAVGQVKGDGFVGSQRLVVECSRQQRDDVAGLQDRS